MTVESERTPNQDAPERMLTAGEAALALACSKRTIYAMAHAGRLSGVRETCRSPMKFRVSAVVAYQNALKSAATLRRRTRKENAQ